jgi:predicted aldo/keto reductase-like oxidoreductase
MTRSFSFVRRGAAEALDLAKRGKVRYVGFTGHKDPPIHLKMLATGFPFDAVQMPLNAFDATFLYLASDAAKFTAGTTLLVDGGWTAA